MSKKKKREFILDDKGRKNWFVEKVVGKKMDNDNKIKYKIKWQNYSMKECTWEPLTNLNGIQDYIEIFETNQSKKLFQKIKNNKLPIFKSHIPLEKKYLKEDLKNKKYYDKLNKKFLKFALFDIEEFDYEKLFGNFNKNKPLIIAKHKILKKNSKDNYWQNCIFKIKWDKIGDKQPNSNYFSFKETEEYFKEGLEEYIQKNSDISNDKI